jgi:hypothetical protein
MSGRRCRAPAATAPALLADACAETVATLGRYGLPEGMRPMLAAAFHDGALAALEALEKGREPVALLVELERFYAARDGQDG